MWELRLQKRLDEMACKEAAEGLLHWCLAGIRSRQGQNQDLSEALGPPSDRPSDRPSGRPADRPRKHGLRRSLKSLQSFSSDAGSKPPPLKESDEESVLRLMAGVAA